MCIPIGNRYMYLPLLCNIMMLTQCFRDSMGAFEFIYFSSRYWSSSIIIICQYFYHSLIPRPKKLKLVFITGSYSPLLLICFIADAGRMPWCIPLKEFCSVQTVYFLLFLQGHFARVIWHTWSKSKLWRIQLLRYWQGLLHWFPNHILMKNTPWVIETLIIVQLQWCQHFNCSWKFVGVLPLHVCVHDCQLSLEIAFFAIYGGRVMNQLHCVSLGMVLT